MKDRGAGAHAPDETERLTLNVDGMHCGACVSAVERAIGTVDGVEEASVNLATREARIVVDPRRASAQDVARAVQGAGYEVAVPEPGGAPESEDTEERSADLFRRFRVGAILSVPVVLLGHHDWVPFLHDVSHETLRLLWALSGLLTLPIMTWVGGRFFTGAWTALRSRRANMDTLVALGTGSAFVYSVVAVAAPGLFPEGTAHPFFEAAAVIITLVVLGQALEARARGSTTSALRSLMDLQPPTARVVRPEDAAGEREEEIPAEDVDVDDVLVVRPGERVPVDGTVIRGRSAIDESMVTGESVPVEKAEGDGVIGGTINRAGSFRMRATRVGKDTVLSQIVELVREAQGSKPPIQRLVDRVSGVFVPIVVTIAIATFFVWLNLGPEPSLNFALVVAVAVLVIACPCALGLATPISVMIAVGKAAENGILVRNGEALQRARTLRTVILDKTGTITRGEPVVTDVAPARGEDEEEVLRLAAAAEAGSEHPLGQAIVAAARERGLEVSDARVFEARGGMGVVAEAEGRRIVVGTPALLREEGVDPASVEALWRDLSEHGRTPALVAVDERPLGAIGLADREKEDSAEAIDRLRREGLDVVMLTGDNERTAAQVAARVGVDRVLAGVLPDGKEEAVQRIRDEVDGRVAMVGDGVNDAPALARADVGIAIGSGTDVAMETADVILMGDSLHGVADTVELSRASVRNMKQNLFGAFVYNTAAIPVAAGVLYPAFGLLLSPMIAGAAMALSSVTVVTNANRLRRFRPSRAREGDGGDPGSVDPGPASTPQPVASAS